MGASKGKVLEYLKFSVSRIAMENMLDVSRSLIPMGENLPDEIWDDCKSIYDIDELYRRLVPIYQEYYDDEDLDFILEFLRNPKSNKFTNLSSDVQTLGKVTEITMGYMNEVVSIITMKIESGGYDIDY